MVTEFKRLLSNKLSIAVMALTLFWLIADGTTRLTSQNIVHKQSDELTEITPLVFPQLTTNLVEQLNSAYQQYNVDKDPLLDSQTGLSAAEQAKQQGELTSVFIDDNKLELKAIIVNKGINQNDADTKALILTSKIKSGEQQIEKFNNNSQVYGYLLVIKNNTQVILTKQQPQGLQKIILTMY